MKATHREPLEIQYIGRPGRWRATDYEFVVSRLCPVHHSSQGGTVRSPARDAIVQRPLLIGEPLFAVPQGGSTGGPPRGTTVKHPARERRRASGCEERVPAGCSSHHASRTQARASQRPDRPPTAPSADVHVDGVSVPSLRWPVHRYLSTPSSPVRLPPLSFGPSQREREQALSPRWMGTRSSARPTTERGRVDF